MFIVPEVLEALRDISYDPAPFPASAQYKSQMCPDADETGDHPAGGKGKKGAQGKGKGKKVARGKGKKVARGKPSKGRSSKKKVATRKRQILKNQKALGAMPSSSVSSAVSPSPSEVAEETPTAAQAPEANAYVPGEYCATRDRFIEKARRLFKINYRAASNMWNTSVAKKQQLRHMSLPELKRRRFVPKEATHNPFAD